MTTLIFMRRGSNGDARRIARRSSFGQPHQLFKTSGAAGAHRNRTHR
jgi:hypothetical protein